MTEADYTIVLDIEPASRAQQAARGSRLGVRFGRGLRRALRSVGMGGIQRTMAGVHPSALQFASGTAGAGIAGSAFAASSLAALTLFRLASGRSFSSTAARLNEVLLGELDEDARAKVRVRSALQDNEILMRALGQTPEMMGDLVQVGDRMYEQARRRERGRSLIEMDDRFQSNDSLLDLLIIRAKNYFRENLGDDPNWVAITRHRDTALRGHR